MNLFTAMLTTMALFVSSSTEGQMLVNTRGGTRPINPAPAENFTGSDEPYNSAPPRPNPVGSQAPVTNTPSGPVQQRIAPGLATLTDDVLHRAEVRSADQRRGFDDLWRRAESGLTRAQIAEVFTHLGFYAGWPKATKAMTAVTRTLAK